MTRTSGLEFSVVKNRKLSVTVCSRIDHLQIDCINNMDVELIVRLI